MAIDLIITLMLAIVGLGLAMAHSTWAVDYTVFVFVFNRGLRRIIDYYVHHQFSSFSPISLSPLIVATALLLPAILASHRIPSWGRALLACLSVSIAYAFAIGFLRVQIAAVYALAEVLAPLGLFAFVLLLKPESSVKDRWIRSFAWAAILASAYGWFQYLTIPEWDKFWLIQTKMVGYMGVPKPTQMTVFSTMSERGVLAGFLGFSVVPMIVATRWRPLPGLFGWLGVILVFSVILLTLSRGGLLFAAIGTASYIVINRGQGGRQIAVAILLLGGAAWFGMDKIPNAERVTKRFESLGDMAGDGSFIGRVDIISTGVSSLTRTPQGLGLGAVGLASRVNAGNRAAPGGSIVDAGWFNILLTYGIPGSVMLLAAMLQAWQLLSKRFHQPGRCDDHVMLARAMMITLIPVCFVGDLLTGFSVFWLALGCGITLPKDLPKRSPLGRGAISLPKGERRTLLGPLPGNGASLPDVHQSESVRSDSEDPHSGERFWMRE